jgi:hypothetical protein
VAARYDDPSSGDDARKRIITFFRKHLAGGGIQS